METKENETTEERIKRLKLEGMGDYYTRAGDRITVRLPRRGYAELVDKVFPYIALVELREGLRLKHRRTVENPDDYVLEFDVVPADAGGE